MLDFLDYLSSVKDVATIVLASLKLFEVLGIDPREEVSDGIKKA